MLNPAMHISADSRPALAMTEAGLQSARISRHISNALQSFCKAVNQFLPYLEHSTSSVTHLAEPLMVDSQDSLDVKLLACSLMLLQPPEQVIFLLPTQSSFAMQQGHNLAGCWE